jgi:hypothetical protein
MNSVKKKAEKLVAVIATYSETNIINILLHIIFLHVYSEPNIISILLHIIFLHINMR